MTPSEASTRLATARFAVLATVFPDGRPHLVPITFAATEDTIVTAIDHKPKTTTSLQRFRNIAADGRVSVLAHHDGEDWDELWWARADGSAVIHDAGECHAAAIDRLVARYEQYRARRPTGPVVEVTVEAWSGWSG